MKPMGMTRGRTRRFGFAFAAVALAGLAGCEQVGDPIEAIGARRPAPDEFKVLPRKPLMVDQALAAATLPTPAPGQPSPLEPDPNAEAVTALLGENAALRPTATASLSAGESALLGAADANAASPDIRYQLESDIARQDEAEANKPYEPPTIGELLLGSDDDEEDQVDPAVALDAVSESQRLQRDGMPAPYDPLAAAQTGEAERPEAPMPEYSSIHSRRPENQLPVEGTGPAFE